MYGEGEEDGKAYWFVDKLEMQQDIVDGKDICATFFLVLEDASVCPTVRLPFRLSIYFQEFRFVRLPFCLSIYIQEFRDNFSHPIPYLFLSFTQENIWRAVNLSTTCMERNWIPSATS